VANSAFYSNGVMQGGSVTTSIFNSLFLVTLSDCMDSTAPLALEVFYDSITVCDLFQRT